MNGAYYENINFKPLGIFGFGIVTGFLLCCIYFHDRGSTIADLNRQQQSLAQELQALQDAIGRERQIVAGIERSIDEGRSANENAREKLGQIGSGFDEDIRRLQQSASILEQIRKRPTEKN